MRDRIAAFREWLGDVFWLRPVLLSLAGIALAEGVRDIDSHLSGPLPPGLLFAGDASGARSLLAMVAGSAIGVAGTIFSITIAALSLTSGQMGPRLLRNFVRDPGHQWALGLFLMTFTYSVALQRGMGAPEDPAVPQLGLAVAVALALVCAASLAWFVHHVASSINVETVISLVHSELRGVADRLTEPEPPPPGAELAMPAPAGAPVHCGGEGYLRALTYDTLVDWAAREDAVISILARPGDYLHPATRVAEVMPPSKVQEAGLAMDAAMTLGDRPAAAQDLEFAVRQLVEVALRALSPGINDPFTAMTVLDRLGSVLASLAGRHLPAPVMFHEGEARLWRRVTDYDGLCDTMFHMLRQAAASHAAVLIRMIEVLDQVMEAESEPARRRILLRHGWLVLGAGRRGIQDAAGLADLELRAARFAAHEL